MNDENKHNVEDDGFSAEGNSRLPGAPMSGSSLQGLEPEPKQQSVRSIKAWVEGQDPKTAHCTFIEGWNPDWRWRMVIESIRTSDVSLALDYNSLVARGSEEESSTRSGRA